MTKPAKKILDDALQLPKDARIDIADLLYASVPDDEVEQAWSKEIRRRVQRVRKGEPAKDWEEVRDRLVRKYTR